MELSPETISRLFVRSCIDGNYAKARIFFDRYKEEYGQVDKVLTYDDSLTYFEYSCIEGNRGIVGLISEILKDTVASVTQLCKIIACNLDMDVVKYLIKNNLPHSQICNFGKMLCKDGHLDLLIFMDSIGKIYKEHLDIYMKSAIKHEHTEMIEWLESKMG
jgi:hypothetical protein